MNARIVATVKGSRNVVAHVPFDYNFGDILTIDGTQYKVAEVNLARPALPILAPVA